MTKPVVVFRSVVIGDPRHTVRLDENSHLVQFPSFSRYTTPTGYNPGMHHFEIMRPVLAGMF
jgi:hypothetical protein